MVWYDGNENRVNIVTHDGPFGISGATGNASVQCIVEVLEDREYFFADDNGTLIILEGPDIRLDHAQPIEEMPISVGDWGHATFDDTIC